MLHMKFREYLPRFEGDLQQEGSRRLGPYLEAYNFMQHCLSRSDGDLKTYNELVKRFYKLSVSRGMHNLLLRADQCSPWDAEEIS